MTLNVISEKVCFFNQNFFQNFENGHRKIVQNRNSEKSFVKKLKKLLHTVQPCTLLRTAISEICVDLQLLVHVVFSCSLDHIEILRIDVSFRDMHSTVRSLNHEPS